MQSGLWGEGRGCLASATKAGYICHKPVLEQQAYYVTTITKNRDIWD